MNKHTALGLSLVFILIVGFILFQNVQPPTENVPQETKVAQQEITPPAASMVVDKQASFAIFTNGTFRVFTAAMYHNLSPDVYIEAGNPNTVHIKKSGVTWGNFFSTLPFKLTHDCLITGTKETFCTGSRGTLQFYLNGERKELVLDEEIQAGDRLLVTYGNESDEVIKKQLERVR